MAVNTPREVISINDDWRFTLGDPDGCAPLVYEARQPAPPHDGKAEALRSWILPSGNRFIADPNLRHAGPGKDPAVDPAYARPGFDDRAWEKVDLPHDWAIKGPFTEAGGGGMGRLPAAGAGWYRKRLDIPAGDAGRSIFLDVDGAMAYAIVWLNGRLVGGWPYGYASFRLDLTPFCVPGGANVLAIRLDNPPDSARWYPGAGLYRDVRLVKTARVHVGQWGTRIAASTVTPAAAGVSVSVSIDNDSDREETVTVATKLFALDARGRPAARPAASLPPADVVVPARGSAVTEGSAVISRPKLWGPPPRQRPNRYLAVTDVSRGMKVIDRSETPFGVRTIVFDPEKGLLVNGERVPLRGVNEHHDLGALGAAFHPGAARRKLEKLREMGCNAVRTAHNPPAPEFLDLADELGFLVLDEIFDAWYREKTPFDFNLVFGDWHEQDLRAFIRRDRNHPSVFMWSVGNEVGEQFAGEEGAAVGARLVAVAHEEDPTRPAAASINWAKPDMPFAAPLDAIALNYQGVGVRRDPPQFGPYHEKFPAKLVFSSESAAAVSSRGEYVFPVAPGFGAPVSPGTGADAARRQVSAYELYHSDFGSSPDKAFAAEDSLPYVAGEFVWSGFDYLGEPSPFDSSRSSYYGIIDLAGFPKDRFYLYQSRWRPDLPMAHILPHWTWPERIGLTTPVHVFTSGDEAELFLNGVSLGRRRKGPYEYRLRWDDVVYEPGILTVVAYRNGRRWASGKVATAGPAAKLTLAPDRRAITADGRDLAFVTCAVTDSHGRIAPRANQRIRFSIEGSAALAATDNGDPTDMEAFPSAERGAFNGLCLAIVRAERGRPGSVVLTATAEGLKPAKTVIFVQSPGRMRNRR